MKTNSIKNLSPIDEFKYKFSICTLVSNPNEYQEMLESFEQSGFNSPVCEYLCIDNSRTNMYDGFSGLNRFIREARGEYIILCHQDIIIHDNIQDLELRINEVDSLDPNWAVLSNAGGINLKWLAMHLIQNCGRKLTEKILPLKAQTVDENFILVKNTANLALSRDLNGFHMYGTDLCLIADLLGFNSYIIRFNLMHKSNGTVDSEFDKLRKELMRKYRRAFRGRFMSTTITRFYLSGNRTGFHILNLGPIMFFVRQYYKFFKPRAGYQPKIK